MRRKSNQANITVGGKMKGMQDIGQSGITSTGHTKTGISPAERILLKAQSRRASNG